MALGFIGCAQMCIYCVLKELPLLKRCLGYNPPTPLGVLWRVRTTSVSLSLPSPSGDRESEKSLPVYKSRRPRLGCRRPPRRLQDTLFLSITFPMPFGTDSNGFLTDFPTQVASQNLPKSTKNRCQEALHLGLRILMKFYQIFIRCCNLPKAWKGPPVL